MLKITFKDGIVVKTKLTVEEAIKRMNRLDNLRVLTEGYENGTGLDIYKKALRAWGQNDNFTGIIRLNSTEKDFLGYLLEREFNSKQDVETLKFYINGGKSRGIER